MKYKICIWENIVSPHQSFFFRALNEHPDIDLQVRYFENFHTERKELGWKEQELPIYEKYADNDVKKTLASIDSWKERIHIIPGISYDFTKQLLEELIKNNVKWIHWSERSGIVLADKLNYNLKLFNVLHPIISKITKHAYAQKMNKYALGAFAQGYLAKQDFKGWGVKEDKIEYLFYTIENIKQPYDIPSELKKFKNKKIFLYVGSLCKRKGIEELLKAYSNVKNKEDTLLVLVGIDRSKGLYEKMVKDLGISNSVIFTGPKPIETIPEYMYFSDIFVLPTLFDGWGAVLNEAASLGKPLISTDQCGAAFHLIKHKYNGFRVKAGDTEELKEALNFYIDNPEQIKIHGENSKKLYLSEFTPEKNVERFIYALNKWVEKGGVNEKIN